MANSPSITVSCSIAQWWKDIRLPLILLRKEFGVPVDIEYEMDELRQAVQVNYQ